ncbi:recombinase family protein [Bacillus inaquosorum]|nr:recombinase family protein [Bacillus inaquosorum]MCY7902771.1 recombinase family protein [Bacillus inaquosorum]MCY8056214.1 recombinase family protein [Bacillus inaquosorum]MCY9072764.1 recombinase family protein [Bacillus inaquosorum]MCY9410451.1 recombinase family protein [Bacillus inaquosorum]MCY9418137.1 recombinase family protein [Bacillus inaquosorum]
MYVKKKKVLMFFIYCAVLLPIVNSRIKGILNNPAYTESRSTQQRRDNKVIKCDSKSYKIRKKVDLDKQIIIKNSHPPLITEDDFRAVQELMKKKGTRKSNGKGSLFAHIAKCSDCGSGMHFKT